LTKPLHEYLARELLGYAHGESGNSSAAREQFAFLTSIPGVPPMKTKSFLLTALSASLLSACSTLDAINPFDKTDAERRAEQGEVAGDDQRISILELSETLKVETPTAPELVVLPDPYVNSDWPQPGGNVAHVVQHTGASGPLDKIWSKDVGEGSGRKGRVIATPVIANGVIYTVDARYNVVATEEATGNKLWNFKLAAIERESTREGMRNQARKSGRGKHAFH